MVLGDATTEWLFHASEREGPTQFSGNNRIAELRSDRVLFPTSVVVVVGCNDSNDVCAGCRDAWYFSPPTSTVEVKH